MGGLKVDGQPTIYLYRGPDNSAFSVIEAELESGQTLPDRAVFMKQLEANGRQAEDRGQISDMQIAPRTVNGADGATYEISGTIEQAGETMKMRTLTALSKKRAYIVIAMGDAEKSLASDHEWNLFLSSLKVNTDKGLLPDWALYSLGGLALLGLLMFLRKKGSPDRRPYPTNTIPYGGRSPSPDGGLGTRAMDGLPTFGGGPMAAPHARPGPSSPTPSRPLGVARTLPPLKTSRPAPPGLSRTIPSKDGP